MTYVKTYIHEGDQISQRENLFFLREQKLMFYFM